jgi:hypothetical protein
MATNAMPQPLLGPDIVAITITPVEIGADGLITEVTSGTNVKQFLLHATVHRRRLIRTMREISPMSSFSDDNFAISENTVVELTELLRLPIPSSVNANYNTRSRLADFAVLYGTGKFVFNSGGKIWTDYLAWEELSEDHQGKAERTATMRFVRINVTGDLYSTNYTTAP